MLDRFSARNFLTNAGMPAGGYVEGVGLRIYWQNGPLGRGEDRLAPNGAFVETVIAAARQRLDHYQGTRFACNENQLAIDALDAALVALNSRTARREAAGTEGTHQL